MSQMEAAIDVSKRYKISNNIRIIEHNRKYIVISVETANWIVLPTEKHLSIFKSLINKSIEETINIFVKCEDDMNCVTDVLIQLEAKKFEIFEVKRPERNGICIYLTNECNLRCPHCYMFAENKSDNELTTEEIKNILREFKKRNGAAVTFTGGEVTLRKDFLDIVVFAKKIGLLITILTNGVSWSENLVECIYPYVDEVQISIDGYDEESNSQVRGDGSFDKSLKTINNLLEKKVKVTLAITPLYEELIANKYKYISFSKNMVNKYNCSDFRVKFNYELIKGREVAVNDDLNSEYRKIINEIIEEVYPGTEENVFALNHEENYILDNCGYGGITISATGDIYFCNRIYEISSYGNVRRMSFGELYDLSSKAESISNINNLRPCNECELKFICGGGCRIRHFPQLTNVEDFDSYDFENIHSRKCTVKDKEKYYELMIKTNELLYR
ncbi:radical SAM/SPASM domain-containing protein [Heliophilum fasciatum]|uniref:Radical SAM protein with 4Fe4S-binding SPASM domain n=1 Tax=Heliophilum fasciatum TaxID=35700 RepID=A0A4R2RJZ5_9FIRM|nr:radical SAM protein [Heliophilum fasciatum]MCW2279403.1 radical SAM protein with 4Fe4S-binding SPASM domain [Heliophilum fasciatum]TCP60001.1 radical SAM protein with 4Fe4S-binding SPASM domain [Heliophilum fasciatum]